MYHFSPDKPSELTMKIFGVLISAISAFLIRCMGKLNQKRLIQRLGISLCFPSFFNGES